MKKPGTITAAVVLALAIGACNGSAGSEATTTVDGEATGGASSAETITIDNFSYSGAETVQVGATVMVTNEDSFAHTWTSEDDVFDSGTLSEGDSFEFTFDEPGEYDYFCAIHPTQMTGTIVVEG